MKAPRAVVIAGPGCPARLLVDLFDRAAAAGFEVVFATADGRALAGMHGVVAPLDRDARPWLAFETLAAIDFDIVLLPGHKAPDRIYQDRSVLEFVRRMDAGGKVVAGLCGGTGIMLSAGIMRDRKACAYDGIRNQLALGGATVVDADVVVDRNLVTGSRHEALGEFMTTAIAVCAERRRQRAP